MKVAAVGALLLVAFLIPTVSAAETDSSRTTSPTLYRDLDLDGINDLSADNNQNLIPDEYEKSDTDLPTGLILVGKDTPASELNQPALSSLAQFIQRRNSLLDLIMMQSDCLQSGRISRETQNSTGQVCVGGVCFTP